ncbi:COG4 transport protein-domain-containing protein [Lanmaoa asiatica]|nr:COG4 transport protein-domain-containing protein [Lanmaoa asiatica]
MHEMRKFCRKLAVDGMVLLKNTGNSKRERHCYFWRGSVALRPTYVVKPFNGIVQNAPSGVEIKYEVGCYSHKYLPTPHLRLTSKHHVITTATKLNNFLPSDLTPNWTIKLEGKITMDKTAVYEFGLAVAGRTKLWVDDELTIDNWTHQTPGDYLYATVEEKADVRLEEGWSVNIFVEYTNTLPPDTTNDGRDKDNSQPALMRGDSVVSKRSMPIKPSRMQFPSQLNLTSLSTSAALPLNGKAKDLTDQPSICLADRTKLGKTNPNMVVCIQAVLAMPWVEDVNGMVQAWHSGNEVGDALADVLHGTVNPSGRLPLTFPVHIEDIPPYLYLHSENGEINCREDLFVGYKYYHAKAIKPLFPFGYGLSYTESAISDLVLRDVSSYDEHFSIKATVKVANSGDVRGSCVVQLYVSLPDVGVTTPRLQLKGFAKAKDLMLRATQNIEISSTNMRYLSGMLHRTDGYLRAQEDIRLERLVNNGIFELVRAKSPLVETLHYIQKDPRKLTNLNEILSCLSWYQSEEAALSNSLAALLSDRASIADSLRRLESLVPHLDDLCLESLQLAGKVSSTAQTADRVGGRVRTLDQKMSRVSQAAERVGQIMELKSSLSQLQSCIERQDWESATRHCARAMSLPFEVISGPFAEISVPTAENHLPPAQTLQAAREQLLSIFLNHFAQASRSRDAAATSRYFKLFPAIGWEAEGLEAYGSFVVDLVRVRAPTSAKTSSPLYYVTVLTALFEGVAMIIDQHQPVVEKYYGAGNMRSVIKRLLEECDRVVRSTLEAWREDRSIKRKVEIFPFLCYLTEFSSSQLLDVSNSMVPMSAPRKQFPTAVEMDDVDPREIDKTLSEIAGMSGRWNLFRKFLVEQLQEEEVTVDREVNSNDQDLQPDSGSSNPRIYSPLSIDPVALLDATSSQREFEDLLSSCYIPMEIWYIRTTIDKAQHLSSPDFSQAPATTTTPDDVFYILKTVYMRLLSTGSLIILERTTDLLKDILDHDFAGGIKKKLDDVYRVGTGVRTEKTEKEGRTSFLVLLNDLDVSSSHMESLTKDLLSQPTITQLFIGIEQPRVKTIVANLLVSTTRFKATLRAGIDQLFNQLMRPRLRTLIPDIYKDVSYVLNEDGYATAEYQDIVRKRFVKAWEGLTDGYKDACTENNYRILFGLALDVILRPWEKYILTLHYSEACPNRSHLGAIRFDRDLRSMMAYLSSQTIFGDIRDKFIRLQQISSLLNLDSDEDVESFYSGSGISWTLSMQEAKDIVSLKA